MYGEQRFRTVHKTVHLVKIYRQRLLNFFSSAYVTLLSTTGYKVLYGTYPGRTTTEFPV